MNPGGNKRKPPLDPASVLGPTVGGHGPVAIVRDLARELLQQGRITLDEAGRIDGALRDHDWPTVRTYVDLGLARRPVAKAAPDNGAATTPAPGAGPTASAPSREPPAEDQVLIAGLLRMVMRLCDALPKLVLNDRSFVERFAPIRALLTARLTPERLGEAEARIAAVIDQQIEMQRDLEDARSSLKDMLTMVVDRLGSIGNTTARFQQRISGYQEELGGQPDVLVVARVVGGLLADTKLVSEEIEKSQQDLADARRKVESYELRVRSLEHELAQTARMVQNDPLTHALNRRGLEEVFRIEVSRSSRYRVPLTVVMIDLDDFKSINDSLGHAAGDRALVHFVTTAQACLRSTELIARTGGEEFVVVFPATGAADCVDAIRRLQRELERSGFQYEGQSRVMTFSGGAAAWREGESLAQILRRADTAMYEAKNGGKDRVVIAG
ncbi:putative Diguanylate cyclase [Burkholderiales bacterium]|nr:putative Diguanylate cyclase [Burkholderiales bacterium]